MFGYAFRYTRIHHGGSAMNPKQAILSRSFCCRSMQPFHPIIFSPFHLFIFSPFHLFTHLEILQENVSRRTQLPSISFHPDPQTYKYGMVGLSGNSQSRTARKPTLVDPCVSICGRYPRIYAIAPLKIHLNAGMSKHFRHPPGFLGMCTQRPEQ